MKSHHLILISPDERLNRIAAPIDVERLRKYPEDAETLANTLIEVARKVDAVGLAAPQLGVGLRMIVFWGDDDKPVICCNPTYVPIRDAGEETKVERCFSTPYVDVQVPRARQIVATWIDLEGATHADTLLDFPARIFQHETDHLDGKCLYERLTEDEKTKYLYHSDSLRVRLADKRAARGLE